MTEEKVKKFVIKYLPLIAIYVVVVSYGFYGTAIRQKKLYDEYNDMQGTVTSFSVNRSGDYLCTIRLNNGMYGSINNGCNIVKVGDTWINQVTSYNPLIGLSGTAYFIIPGELKCLSESLAMFLSFILPLIGVTVGYIGVHIYSWIKSH
jgi:hypothetical protein